MTEIALKEQLDALLGASKSTSCDYKALKHLLDKTKVTLESYLLWVGEKYGVLHLRSKITSNEVMRRFLGESLTAQTSFPQHIYNAAVIFSNISESGILDSNIVDKLISMSMPAAVFFLMAAEGYEIGKLRAEARKYITTFPTAVIQLPEVYVDVAKKLVGEYDSTG